MELHPVWVSPWAYYYKDNCLLFNRLFLFLLPVLDIFFLFIVLRLFWLSASVRIISCQLIFSDKVIRIFHVQDVWQGTQLLAIDVAAALGLLRRSIVGDELTDKEKQALRRTLTDLASVVPIGFLMLLPVSSSIPFFFIRQRSLSSTELAD